MKKIIYPGTFDPVTYGHIDIIQRASELFDSIVVTVAVNPSKSPLFSLEERLFLLKESLKDINNVVIDSFEGLTVDYAHKVGAIGILRGLRAISDFEYEFQMALTNRKIAENIETVFLMPGEKYSYISSTLVREIARYGGDVKDFVPVEAVKIIAGKYKKI